MIRASRRREALCNCDAYRFPHRASGGQCPADSRDPQDLCASCLMPADATTVDFGIGAYEYWGCKGVHRDIRTVSACCEDDLIDNSPSRGRARLFPTTGVRK